MFMRDNMTYFSMQNPYNSCCVNIQAEELYVSLYY